MIKISLWDLRDVKFKDSVEDFNFTLNGHLGMNNDNQGIIISSFLESTSLDTFIMRYGRPEEPAFGTIVSSCSSVKTLLLIFLFSVQCSYASIASFLGDDRSVIRELKIISVLISEVNDCSRVGQ